MGKIKVFTAFSGYDSQCMALDRLGIEYELVGWSEIDKYAIQAHNAVYPQYSERNFGDISKIDWDKVPDFDLFTLSFPCTDISSAGLQKGLEEGSGTRSALLWECRQAILTKKPKYLLMENVKTFTSKKFLPSLLKWEAWLRSIGYSNFTKVLNAKDYGIPQNRERVFMVSYIDQGDYIFPKPFVLEKRLKDILEEKVNEKYYLSEKTLKGFLKTSECKSHNHNFKPRTGEDLTCTIKTNAGSRVDDNFILEPVIYQAPHGYMKGNIQYVSPSITTSSWKSNNFLVEHKSFENVEEEFNRHTLNLDPDMCCIGYTRDKSGKVVKRHIQNYCNTIHGSTGSGGNTDCLVYERDKIESAAFRIRKLTPRECFRLMGVSEENIDKIQAAGISNTQQYKLAGNSIVVDCLYYIFKQLFYGERNESYKQLSLF